MPNFKTQTAEYLHSVFLNIADGVCELSQVFDTFLELHINMYSKRTRATTIEQLRTNNFPVAEKQTADAFDKAIDMFGSGMQREKCDVLGDYFEHAGLARKDLGQVLTPQSLADFTTTQAAKPYQKRKVLTVCDPCCGSGRFLLAAAEQLPQAMLVGIDVDRRMARMSAINLALFKRRALIICGDMFDIQPGFLHDCEFVEAYQTCPAPQLMLKLISPKQNNLASHFLQSDF